MKVLLIRPKAPNKLSFTKILDNEPLELEYLHTGLAAAGYVDYIYDGFIEKISIEATIKREEPDIVAIGGYITQENLMKAYCRKAKKINPQIITVIGGVHAQLNPHRFFDQDVDYICRSESIDAFVTLVRCLEANNKDAMTLSKINGLCFKDEGSLDNNSDGFIMNPITPIDINTLLIPDRSFFYKNKSEYRYLDLTEAGTIKTSFSCPYTCNFCYCTLLNGSRYQERDLDLVIKELKDLDCQNVQIVDDDFLVNKKRLWQFIDLIKTHKIHKTYTCYGRADFIADNPELIHALSEIGFKYFLVGLEAVTDKELDGYGKGSNLDHNSACVKVIQETTSHCIGLMIAPLEATETYFEDLYDWVVLHDLKYVTVSIFTPIPGTPLYETYKDKITSTSIEDWDFLHLVLDPIHMSRQAFYRAYYRLFIRLYKIAKKTGIYDFMDLDFYRKMLKAYLTEKIKGG
ncbi:B12-binding domain-containing radical SAM protein [Petrocella sp. FN5]|uniref:B12-binding domain-containing radical SAM protein n=1 Tax=Petrocella sp. FN5 TaxID=3032002 RepID=UPI0023DB7D6D|nr:cobalamin-dependent protein [Petrocella sp. FN5]MDF1618207.1 cobalamin-dependent protein [Petrocella sp. FN5]